MILKDIISKLNLNIDKLKVLETSYLGLKKGDVYNTQKNQIDNSIKFYKNKLINYGKSNLFKVIFTFVSDKIIIEKKEIFLVGINRDEIDLILSTRYKDYTILLIENIPTGLK
jgi:hypothetical protein